MALKAAVSMLTLVSREAKLIDDMNDWFNFDHNIILIDSSAADVDPFVRAGDQPKSIFIFENSNGGITGLEDLRKIESKNPFMIVVTESSRFARNVNLLKEIKDIQQLHRNLKIGFFFRRIISMENLRAHFLWFKYHSVANVFAGAYTTYTGHSLNLFSYHPFRKFKVMNVTRRSSCRELFPSLDSNFHRHELRLTPFVSIFYEQVWLAVLQVMNATFSIVNFESKDAAAYANLGIDIVPKLAGLQENASSYPLYPVISTHENIVVPKAEPYLDFNTYILMLTTNELFGYIAAAILAIVVLLSVCRFIKQKEFHFFQSLADVLNLLINDNCQIKYQRLSRAEAFLVGPLTFIGFVVVNAYLSDLQSYFTKPFLQPQLRTLADIYNSSMTITVPVEIRDLPIATILSRLTDKDWSNKVIEIDSDDMNRLMYSFNTSTSYVMSDMGINLVSRVQKRLGIRGYYDTGVSVDRKPAIFKMTEAFLFFDKLNAVIDWTRSSGLFDRWLEVTYSGGENVILEFNNEKLKRQDAVDVKTFEFPMFIVYGWIAGTIVLMIEIMWTKLSIQN